VGTKIEKQGSKDKGLTLKVRIDGCGDAARCVNAEETRTAHSTRQLWTRIGGLLDAFRPADGAGDFDMARPRKETNDRCFECSTVKTEPRVSDLTNVQWPNHDANLANGHINRIRTAIR